MKNNTQEKVFKIIVYIYEGIYIYRERDFVP